MNLQTITHAVNAYIKRALIKPGSLLLRRCVINGHRILFVQRPWSYKRLFTYSGQLVVLSVLLAPMTSAQGEWKVDFSRRQKEIRKEDYAVPIGKQKKDSLFDVIFAAKEAPLQEVVILNTDKGFIPSTVRVRQGLQYKIHVVNVNEKDKNVSFVLDAFSEHHATYYGTIKTFVISPRKEGIYTFQSPETSAQGRVVVLGQSAAKMRLPAGE